MDGLGPFFPQIIIMYERDFDGFVVGVVSTTQGTYVLCLCVYP